jgi:hypothetical protein
MSEPSRELRVRNAGEADEMKIIELLSRAFRRWPQFEIPGSAMVDESRKRPQYFEVDFGISHSSDPRLQHRNVRKGSEYNLSARAFRHLASLAGADPRQMASNLPKKIWNFIA